ncbi:MAG: LUD domain-containing protein [Nostocoides sp.]
MTTPTPTPASAREVVLARVRAALADVDPGMPLAPVPLVRGRNFADRSALLDLFVERVVDYRATVVRTGPEALAAVVADALHGIRSIVVPADLELDVQDATSDGGQSAHALDGFDAVVTRARVAIAETGTVVLDHGPGQGRRALSLVPDRHVCIVQADQVVADVPDAIARLDPFTPQTWISGPSATSDIELSRVEGVHGPRTLIIILIDPTTDHPDPADETAATPGWG